MTPQLQEDIYAALSQTHQAFMPARTMSQFDSMRRSRGLSDPDR